MKKKKLKGTILDSGLEIVGYAGNNTLIGKCPECLKKFKFPIRGISNIKRCPRCRERVSHKSQASKEKGIRDFVTYIERYLKFMNDVERENKYEFLDRIFGMRDFDMNHLPKMDLGWPPTSGDVSNFFPTGTTEEVEYLKKLEKDDEY